MNGGSDRRGNEDEPQQIPKELKFLNDPKSAARALQESLDRVGKTVDEAEAMLILSRLDLDDLRTKKEISLQTLVSQIPEFGQATVQDVLDLFQILSRTLEEKPEVTSAKTEISKLIRSMFENDEIRRLVRRDFPDLSSELPAGTVTLKELADRLVDLLLKSEQVNAFLDSMKRERNRRIKEVELLETKLKAGGII